MTALPRRDRERNSSGGRPSHASTLLFTDVHQSLCVLFRFNCSSECPRTAHNQTVPRKRRENPLLETWFEVTHEELRRCSKPRAGGAGSYPRGSRQRAATRVCIREMTNDAEAEKAIPSSEWQILRDRTLDVSLRPTRPECQQLSDREPRSHGLRDRVRRMLWLPCNGIQRVGSQFWLLPSTDERDTFRNSASNPRVRLSCAWGTCSLAQRQSVLASGRCPRSTSAPAVARGSIAE